MKFIIRLFPEISIKSKPVRTRLIKLVRQNIGNVCARHQVEVSAICEWDKILATFPSTEDSEDQVRSAALRELTRIPGIHSFMEVKEFRFTSLEALFDDIRDLCGGRIVGHTFAVRVKRVGNHDFNSQQAERVLGGKFKAAFMNKGVNLEHPEVTIHIEIEHDRAYVSGERVPGLGGYPVGSQGEVLALISGGFDSGVAAYQSIHRGCKVNYLFFNMGGSAHELGVKQESFFLWDRYAASHKVRFITVPFEETVGQILERTHHGVRGVILKRMMMRVGSRLARRFRCEALVTGESLGQVSSQTMRNLKHIDDVCEVLLIRPLITCDKQDIVDKSRAIGTLGFAESMPEYCGVISDHPNICPEAEFVLEQEARMEVDALVERALEACSVMEITGIPENTSRLETEVEIVDTLGPHDVVLDVRAPDDVQRSPLNLSDHQVIALPFYRVARDFNTLDRLRTYALYCDQGVMSLMQARQLKEAGHHNIRVWRP